eukprot:7198442-Alexandrium_andersonii.AAC.1
MGHRSISKLDDVTLVRLAGRLVPLKHMGGGLRVRHRGRLEVCDPACKHAQLTVGLGELGAQLNVELVELRGRRGTHKP